MLDLFSETEERKVCSFLKISSIVFLPIPIPTFQVLNLGETDRQSTCSKYKYIRTQPLQKRTELTQLCIAMMTNNY